MSAVGYGFTPEYLDALDVLQFNALMDEINYNICQTRIGRVYDAAVGAQADNDGIKAHVKGLEKASGVEFDESNEFLQNFGGGI